TASLIGRCMPCDVVDQLRELPAIRLGPWPPLTRGCGAVADVGVCAPGPFEFVAIRPEQPGELVVKDAAHVAVVGRSSPGEGLDETEADGIEAVRAAFTPSVDRRNEVLRLVHRRCARVGARVTHVTWGCRWRVSARAPSPLAGSAPGRLHLHSMRPVARNRT